MNYGLNESPDFYELFRPKSLFLFNVVPNQVNSRSHGHMEATWEQIFRLPWFEALTLNSSFFWPQQLNILVALEKEWLLWIANKIIADIITL